VFCQRRERYHSYDSTVDPTEGDALLIDESSDGGVKYLRTACSR